MIYPLKIVIFHSYVNIYQRVPTKRVFMMSCVFEKCVVSILPEMILKDISNFVYIFVGVEKLTRPIGSMVLLYMVTFGVY